MATNASANEGFRLLDDFACDAIHEPGIPRADAKKQGKNEGIRVIEEIVFGGTVGARKSSARQALAGSCLVSCI